MAKYRYSRVSLARKKELETPDEFLTYSQQALAFVLKHQLKAAIGLGVFFVLAILFLGGRYYFHLKEKSVRVEVGEKVRRGQHIGDVGNTGDSFEVHLHFQVNDSADFANGRSLPFSFENIQAQFREPGRFVKPKK